MTDLGIRFFVNPEILAVSNMGLALTKWVSAENMGALCFIAGLSRCFIMFFENAFRPWGVHIRLGITFLAGFIWAIMTVGFLESFLMSAKPLPPGFDMMFAQTIGELLVTMQLAREM